MDALIGQAQRSEQLEQERQYLLSQQQAAAQQVQKPVEGAGDPWWKKFWSPPEYDPSWEQMLEVDDKGQVRGKAGAPPDLPWKHAQYASYRRQQADRMMANPYEFFEPAIKHLAEQVADTRFQSGLKQYEEAAYAASFVKNTPWLYQRDAQNQVILNPVNGQPQYSEMGRSFAGHVASLDQQGVKDIRMQQAIASRLAQADMMEAQLRAAQSGAANQQQKDAFLKQAAGGGQPNVAGAITPPLNGNGSANNTPAGMSLFDMLMQNMEQAGYQRGQTIEAHA